MEKKENEEVECSRDPGIAHAMEDLSGRWSHNQCELFG